MDPGSSYTNAWNKSLSEFSIHHHILSLVKHKDGTRAEIRVSVGYTRKVSLNICLIVTLSLELPAGSNIWAWTNLYDEPLRPLLGNKDGERDPSKLKATPRI